MQLDSIFTEIHGRIMEMWTKICEKLNLYSPYWSIYLHLQILIPVTEMQLLISESDSVFIRGAGLGLCPSLSDE